ncbi:MAG: dihydroorotase [Gemmatimonadetes bacterium]|nr:dihydroorotase [Gemmatimonadota bacterium]
MHSRDLLISGGRLVDPEADELRRADLLIRDGKVVALSPNINADVPVLDATGLIVSPGFIDLHVHFREPGQEWKEDIDSGSRCAAAGGFTTVCAMPNTDPPLHDQESVRFVVERAREVGLVDLHVVGAVTTDLAGTILSPMGEMAAAGCVAFSDDGRPILDSGLMRRALEYSRQFYLPIVQHAEDTGLTRGGAMNESAISTKLGLTGMHSSAEEIVVARDLALLPLTGGRYHVAHTSCARTIELLRRARAEGLPVSCEVTPHHLALDEQAVSDCDYDANYKMNPPLRSVVDREAMIQGCVDGTIDAIATDHAPHLPDEKEIGFSAAPFGVIGLETAFSVAATTLLPHMSLRDLLRLLTTGPASVFGFKDRGRLAPGLRGDVVLFDSESEAVYSVESTHSKSRNSAFDGMRLQGKIVATVLEGRVVFGESR